jgi:hypothetical protein
MNIERQDNILRYVVDSRTRTGVTHVVELDLYDGNGGCTCENFAFEKAPMLKRGVVAKNSDDDSEADSLRCAHIKAARRKLVDDIIEQIAHKPELATARKTREDARQRVGRVPPPRYSGKRRKRKPRPATAQR